MPIYEYACSACGHQLEAFQAMSDAPLADCPVCQKTALQKQISSCGFQLKGTGWYVTDFRNKGKADTSITTTSSSTGASTATTPTTPTTTTES